MTQPLNRRISVCFRLGRAGPLIGDRLKAGLHYTGWHSIGVDAFVEIMRVSQKPATPRIHGELLKLGFDISERTVSGWVKRANQDPDPAPRWLAFLRNHREAITAMDFFTVPTLTFGVLYCHLGERWVGSVRRDLLDHVIVLNQRHLRRLLKKKIGLTSG